jgi:hypothetical protein
VLIDRIPKDSSCLHLMSGSSHVLSFATFVLHPHVRDHVASTIWSQQFLCKIFLFLFNKRFWHIVVSMNSEIHLGLHSTILFSLATANWKASPKCLSSAASSFHLITSVIIGQVSPVYFSLLSLQYTCSYGLSH